MESSEELDEKETVECLTAKKAVPRRTLKPLSEHYDDEMQIDAFLTDRSIAEQAASLLQAKLKERQEFRDNMLAKMAKKKGVSPELLRYVILTGKLPDLTDEERKSLKKAVEKYQSEREVKAEQD